MATIDLSKYGITGTTEIIRNPSYEFLFEEETKAGLEGYDRGQVTDLGGRQRHDRHLHRPLPQGQVHCDGRHLQGYRVVDLRRVQKRQQARLSGGLGCLQRSWRRSACPTSACL